MLDIVLLGYILNGLGFLGMIIILLPVLMLRKIEYISDYNNTLEYLKSLKKLHKLQTFLNYLIPFYGFFLFGGVVTRAHAMGQLATGSGGRVA